MIRPILLAAVAALAVHAAAFADASSLTTEVFKETQVQGADGAVKTVLAPIGRVVPGDQLVYVLTYHNAAAAPASGVVITNPLPTGMTYAGPRDDRVAQVSVDGQAFGDLAQLRVTKDGQSQPASLGDVAALRWPLSETVPAGGEVTLSYRARLN